VKKHLKFDPVNKSFIIKYLLHFPEMRYC